MAEFFKNNYQGDANPDMIRDEAVKLGLIQASQEQVDQTQQMQNLDQFSQASQGAPPPRAPGDEEQMWQEFTDALRKGEDSEAVLRRYGKTVASDAN
jgi:hypothetical protein